MRSGLLGANLRCMALLGLWSLRAHIEDDAFRPFAGTLVQRSDDDRHVAAVPIHGPLQFQQAILLALVIPLRCSEAHLYAGIGSSLAHRLR